MPETCRHFASRPPATRSRVSNGSALLPGTDGRSAQARRFRDLCFALADDLSGPGGALGQAEHLQIRNAAALQLHVEELTAKVVRGETVSAEEITRASNAASRALNGLKARRAPRKPARPDLHAYLAGKPRQAAEVQP